MSSSTERPHPGPITAERRQRRLQLVHVTDDKVGAVYRAHVVLEGPGGARYEGRAELPAKDQNYLRAACRATIEALRRLVDDAAELELIGVRRLGMEGGDAIVVQIASRVGGKPRLLQGAALASASPDLDAARAVLHATNRLVIRYLPG
jgi:hypothetical protein